MMRKEAYATMSKTDAVYMRAYRARKKAEREAYIVNDKPHKSAPYLQAALDAANDEIRHLKEELAKRSSDGWSESAERAGMSVPQLKAKVREADTYARGFNSKPFTPVPKKGHG